MHREPLPHDPDLLVERLLPRDRRVLLFGPSGSGKTTLAATLARLLDAQGRRVSCLAADPGSPAFGAPGALSLGDWRGDGWALRSIEALCTLDAARFRLPLVAAARTLALQSGDWTLLVDTPGVVRGVAGAELLQSLVQATSADLILVLTREDQPLPLAQELAGLGIAWVRVQASPEARRPGEAARARTRTRLWEGYLAAGSERVLDLKELRRLGTPPRPAPEAWQGKQIAFLEAGHTRALGEVLGLEGRTLRVRLPPGQGPTDTLLVRDATRGEDGKLGTSKGFASQLVRYLPPSDLLADGLAGPGTGARPVAQLGTALACLVNGVFGDPLLHLRLGHQRRSLLFDLGEGARLPARIAHQVTDCFISHAHADHIGGFLWLLRSRIGEDGPCRLYGPPGLARHVQGLVDGILWDRIGDQGPVFEVTELRGGHLYRGRIQAGRPGPSPLGERPIEGSVLLDEAGLRVRCALLDHGTPVLAFAFEQTAKVKVIKERLLGLGLAPGPWLRGLKQRILAGDHGSGIELPDGRHRRVADLAAELTGLDPGGTLVYATDLADTPENRRRLIALAKGAQYLFCEAGFLGRDRVQAERTGHLSARACGEIAAAAGVRHLIPFHFSRRYESEPYRIYEEIALVCPQVVIPKGGGADHPAEP